MSNKISKEVIEDLVNLAVEDWDTFSDLMKVYLIDDFNFFYNLTYLDFRLFVFSVYAWAVQEYENGNWCGGKYVAESADFLQKNKWTMFVGARGHWKSMRFYAYVMHIIWKNLYDNRHERIFYFSYKTTQARDHVNLIKEFIKSSEIFTVLGLKDKKSSADTLAIYSFDDKHNISIRAFGILESTRGKHGRYVLVDDPLKDDSNPSKPTNVMLIKKLFKDVVESIPNPDNGILHVIGTPMSQFDMWYDKATSKKYKIEFKPAIYEENGEEKALWPERFPLSWLIEQRESGYIETTDGNLFSFSQEYLCEPRSVHNSFFNKQKLEKSIDNSLIDWNMSDPRFVNKHERFTPDEVFPVYGGLDLGKKQHPGHLAIFQYNPHIDQLVQVHSHWFQKINYTSDDPEEPTQLKYLKDAVKYFNIQKIIFDNTRGEFETILERNVLPQLEPVSIGQRNKVSMAVEIENRLGTDKLKLLPEERQKSQLLSIQGDLSCIATSQGHGEPLTSIGLVCLHVAKFRKAQSQTIKISSVDINRGKFKPAMIKPIGLLKRDLRPNRKRL